MADFKVVDAEQLDNGMKSLANKIRSKSGTTALLTFPTGMENAVDNIKDVINGTNPTTLTTNGNHSTGGYSNVEVNVPPPEGYIKPSGNSPTITTNGTHNVKQYENAVVNVPVPNNYIDKTKISHFATGVINNVTEGQQVRITGITDAMTGETFNLKGVVGILCPTATTNYTTSAGKGALVAFYKTSDNTDGIGVAAYTSAYSVRANVGMKNNDILGISGNGFSFLSPASMYALMPATRWRWFAWG